MIAPVFEIGEFVTSSNFALTKYEGGQTPPRCWQVIFRDVDRGLVTVACITGTYPIERGDSLDERILVERVDVNILESWTSERPWWSADMSDILGVLSAKERSE